MKDELLYEQIIKSIRGKISGGEFFSGDKAPSIAVIRREFNVSPVTAVRALKELTLSGDLEKLPGRGYFVAGRKSAPIPSKGVCVGCMLRANYVSLRDHYFNEVISGVQEVASLARVNLLTTYLSTQLCSRQSNLDSELVASALDMRDLVSGYLMDERISDATVREIMEKTGKPAVILNRTTELPIFSVSPDYRSGLFKLMETLIRMGYEYFIFSLSGMKNPVQFEKENIFFDMAKTLSTDKKQFVILDQCSIVPFSETLRKLQELLKSCASRKTVVVTSTDGISRDFIDALKPFGYSVPRNFGMVATDGLSITSQCAPEITTLKVDTVKIGATAMQLLLQEINRSSQEPPQNRLLMPNLIFGETI